MAGVWPWQTWNWHMFNEIQISWFKQHFCFHSLIWNQVLRNFVIFFWFFLETCLLLFIEKNSEKSQAETGTVQVEISSIINGHRETERGAAIYAGWTIWRAATGRSPILWLRPSAKITPVRELRTFIQSHHIGCFLAVNFVKNTYGLCVNIELKYKTRTRYKCVGVAVFEIPNSGEFEYPQKASKKRR